jgi:biopolymer transport protein TolQ
MNEMFRLLLNLGFVAKMVLLVLAILSVISWAVIIEKWRFFRKMRKETHQFLQVFRMKSSPEELLDDSREFQNSPMARMFRRIYQSSGKWKESYNDRGDILSLVEPQPSEPKQTPVSMTMAVDGAHASEISRMEERLIILSTTVSVSPFLGLLGTVWGIMSAFISIGVTGSASLASVGPGIAEALVTTAAGLAVAIPALIAYNFFVDGIRRWDEKLDDFSTDLYHLRQREKVQ